MQLTMLKVWLVLNPLSVAESFRTRREIVGVAYPGRQLCPATSIPIVHHQPLACLTYLRLLPRHPGSNLPN
jgi:hypothetical protein